MDGPEPDPSFVASAASSLAKPDVRMDHHASQPRPIDASAPACWFNRRCRGGEHTAQEVLSYNRSLGND